MVKKMVFYFARIISRAGAKNRARQHITDTNTHIHRKGFEQHCKWYSRSFNDKDNTMTGYLQV